MKSAGKARSNGLYRHIRTSKEIIRNLLNDFTKHPRQSLISPPQREIVHSRVYCNTYQQFCLA